MELNTKLLFYVLDCSLKLLEFKYMILNERSFLSLEEVRGSTAKEKGIISQLFDFDRNPLLHFSYLLRVFEDVCASSALIDGLGVPSARPENQQQVPRLGFDRHHSACASRSHTPLACLAAVPRSPADRTLPQRPCTCGVQSFSEKNILSFCAENYCRARFSAGRLEESH